MHTQIPLSDLKATFPQMAMPWLNDPLVTKLLKSFRQHAMPLHFVGGCVRDGLLGLTTYDLDLCTPAPMESWLPLVQELTSKVNTKGLRYGGITVHLGPYEVHITRLRQDVESLGRQAHVSFTDDLATDSNRRDLTINAIYLHDDMIEDFHGGLEDLKHGKIQIIGEPPQRFAEDTLRVLRTLRFYAHYGRTPLDDKLIMALQGALPLLAQLSSPRIGQELLKLLTAPNPLPALQLMENWGMLEALLPHIGYSLPRLGIWLQVEPTLQNTWCGWRLAILINHEDFQACVQAFQLGKGWKLNKSASITLKALQPQIKTGHTPQTLDAIKDMDCLFSLDKP